MSGFNALLDPGQIGMGIQESFRQGREDMRAERARQAFSQYATDPNEQNAAAIAQHDPRIGMAMMDREAERQQQQMVQAQKQQERFLQIVQWVDSQPNKEDAFQRGLQIAAQSGMPIDGVPRTYAEATQSGWLQNNVAMAQIFLKDPAKASEYMQRAMELTGLPASDPRTIEVAARLQSRPLSVEAGGEAWVIDPLTGIRQIVAANPGGMTPGAPVGDIPRVTSPDEARRLPPGTRFIDPNGIERIVPGGGGGNATGPFPGAGN